MTKIYMVRHGEAAAHWSEDRDPGLSTVGREQAEKVAENLKDLGPLPILTSPLQRTRETALPFERQWKLHAAVEPAITEIPTPDIAMDQRGPWLMEVMGGSWADHASQPVANGTLGEWREQLIGRMLTITEDTLMTSHFIAINVAVGWALGNDALITFKPDNASCTVLEVIDGQLSLISLGEEAQTKVG